MRTCQDCGASLRFGLLDGERIPVDAHETMRGPDRYIFEGDKLVAVSPTADVLAFPDHRKSCRARLPTR
jgi:hypothetical protein